MEQEQSTFDKWESQVEDASWKQSPENPEV